MNFSVLNSYFGRGDPPVNSHIDVQHPTNKCRNGRGNPGTHYGPQV